MTRHTNAAGLALIKEVESCRLTAYQDDGGVWTIGWGHTDGVQQGDTWTQQQADDALVSDVGIYERCVEDRLEVGITDNQFSALVVFVYNVGCEAFKSSTLLELLNEGSTWFVPQQMLRWNKVGGVVSKGLTIRRNKEVYLWLSEAS